MKENTEGTVVSYWNAWPLTLLACTVSIVLMSAGISAGIVWRLRHRRNQTQDVTETEQLAAEKERTRLTQQLHDAIGHDLVCLMTLAEEMVAAVENQTGEQSRETAGKILSLSKDLLKNVRGCIRGYDDGNAGIGERLDALIRRMRFASIPVGLSIEGEENRTHAFAAEAVCHIVKEAVTNAVRHGRAGHIDVVVKFLADKVQVNVLDNGRGCGKIHKHMGLSGMEGTVHSLGGQIRFRSGEEEGFAVMVSIPVSEREKTD
ncbi:MAG: histidine kinase [Gracilibacteraceae bacterium]|nr:histidine kinase [Gracilibacteraceae bacterium]